ncbi:MAG: hypothetical protein ACTJG4_01560, partial [Vreelandella alkaliphila]|uniref:hypothetical protein n=1 Tax=Vreelandella alkaliphila TaxID=272774 RepID=UPI003F9A86C8
PPFHGGNRGSNPLWDAISYFLEIYLQIYCRQTFLKIRILIKGNEATHLSFFAFPLLWLLAEIILISIVFGRFCA